MKTSKTPKRATVKANGNIVIITSFAELEELAYSNRVIAEDLVHTFRNYATGGAGIAPHVVCSLINRLKPTASQLQEMATLALNARNWQKNHGHSLEAANYLKVYDHVCNGISK